MASFAGTTQKCKVCEKKVYWVEQLTTDNKVYHKSCFRCHHCKGTLKLSNYCSFEGVLYCKPHFDQLFKMTGSLDKSFKGIARIARLERSSDQEFNRYKPTTRCQDCLLELRKSVLDARKQCTQLKRWPLMENLTISHGGCVISPSNYVAHEHRLYCRHHHAQLFKQKGNFSQFDKHIEQVQGITEINITSE